MSPPKVFLANSGMRPYNLMVTPPLGIMYLAAFLRDRMSIDLELYNQKLENDPHEALAERAAAFGADVVGLTTLTPTARGLGRTTALIRERLPNALIVLGGPHISAVHARALDGNLADAAVAGEGELVFEQIIRTHQEGGSLADIPGLYWRDRDGEVVTNPGVVPVVPELDDLPFPAYDLIDLESYWRQQSGVLTPGRRKPHAALFTSRGCPYACNFCHDVYGKKFRQHSADRIVEEIEFYQKRYGISEVDVLDDIFNLNPKRLFRFVDRVHERGLKFGMSFPNGVRTDILTEESIEALVSSGLYFAGFALESASPRIQESMGKKLDIDRYFENVTYAADRGVFLIGFTMLGFPTETEEEMLMTIDRASASKLHMAYFQTAIPFPGTELHQLVSRTHADKLRGFEFDDISFRVADFNFSDVPDERFFEIRKYAWRKFFSSPSRFYRILRDHPAPHQLPLYVPEVFRRVRGHFASRETDATPSLALGARHGEA